MTCKFPDEVTAVVYRRHDNAEYARYCGGNRGSDNHEY